MADASAASLEQAVVAVVAALLTVANANHGVCLKAADAVKLARDLLAEAKNGA